MCMLADIGTFINSQIHKQHKHQQRHEHQQETPTTNTNTNINITTTLSLTLTHTYTNIKQTYKQTQTTKEWGENQLFKGTRCEHDLLF